MSIYRQYEDPYKLEQKLEELKEELKYLHAINADPYEIQDIQLEIAELKDRINSAWQDDEFDCDQDY